MQMTFRWFGKVSKALMFTRILSLVYLQGTSLLKTTKNLSEILQR